MAHLIIILYKFCRLRNTLKSFSLWEETGENPRLSAEFWRTLPPCDQMFDTGLEPVTTVVGGRRLDDWATKAPPKLHRSPCTYIWLLYLLQDQSPTKGSNFKHFTTNSNKINTVPRLRLLSAVKPTAYDEEMTLIYATPLGENKIFIDQVKFAWQPVCHARD